MNRPLFGAGRALVAFAGVCWGIPSVAQSAARPEVLTDTAPAPSVRFPADWYPAPSQTVYTESIQAGLPYTATLVTTGRFKNPRTGEVRVVTQRTLQARDGKGRKRDEQEMPRPGADGKPVMTHEVTVFDPVSHCTFRWMEPWAAPGPPTATVTCLPRVLRYWNQNIWAEAVKSPAEVRSRLSVTTFVRLGTRSMQGLQAVGVRRTKTDLAQDGSERDRVVAELWYSPELQELLSMSVKVEQTGHAADDAGFAPPEFELTEIRRGEPNPALFYPPAGYRIESALPGEGR